MRYRAIVGIKKSSATNGCKKAERESIEIELMKELLKHWDSKATVLPYYDPSYDVDANYTKILKTSGIKLPKHVNVDDPEAVMNFIGSTQGRVFYTEIPRHDRKNRSHALREYKKKCEEFEKNDLDIPQELEDKYKHELLEPKPGEKTGLFSYCVINPNGLYSSYNFPIEHSYINNISDVSASKLLNRNYGTMHDIILMGDLDFEGTYFPHVVFRNDGEVLESYPEQDDDADADVGGDANEIRDFLEETMDREDYVAVIECIV